MREASTMAGADQSDPESLVALLSVRRVMQASLERVMRDWQLGPIARDFARGRLDHLLGDDELADLLADAECAMRPVAAVLCERMVSELVCLLVLVGRGVEDPASLAAIVRGSVQPAPVH
jgi:hypothetical protein